MSSFDVPTSRGRLKDIIVYTRFRVDLGHSCSEWEYVEIPWTKTVTRTANCGLARGIFFSLTVCIPHNGQTAIYDKRSCTVGVQLISSGYQTNVGDDDPRSLCG